MSKKEELYKIFNGWEESVPANLVEPVKSYVDSLSDSEIDDFLQKYEVAGEDWGFSAGSPIVGEIMRLVLGKMINFHISGAENLDYALKLLAENRTNRVVIVSNHLSYSDANIFAAAFDSNLKQAGFGNQLAVVAGPKVFSHPIRKFASMHFDSLLIAQSQTVATVPVAYPIRVVARSLTKVVDEIKSRVKIFLVFPEGKRSRTGSMDSFLAGVYRMIDTGENVLVLPVSIVGGEKFLPISDKTLHCTDVAISVGMSEYVADIIEKIGDSQSVKQDFMDYLGRRVAEMLPPERHGVYK